MEAAGGSPYLESAEDSDAYFAAAELRGELTPFGIPCGQIPMGTVGEVLGAEKASIILRQLEASQHQSSHALRRQTGFSGLMYMMP